MLRTTRLRFPETAAVAAPSRLAEQLALASRDSDAFNQATHVQMFNALAGTEAGGNATLRPPHPVTSARAGHFAEVMFVAAPVCGQLCSHGNVRNTHTYVSGDADYTRSQMLYQRFSVTNTDTQYSPSRNTHTHRGE